MPETLGVKSSLTYILMCKTYSWLNWIWLWQVKSRLKQILSIFNFENSYFILQFFKIYLMTSSILSIMNGSWSYKIYKHALWNWYFSMWFFMSKKFPIFFFRDQHLISYFAHHPQFFSSNTLQLKLMILPERKTLSTLFDSLSLSGFLKTGPHFLPGCFFSPQLWLAWCLRNVSGAQNTHLKVTIPLERTY